MNLIHDWLLVSELQNELKSMKDIPNYIELTDKSVDIKLDNEIKVNNNIKIIDKDIEKRIDIYDNKYYTKDEFMEYYNGLSEWNYQNPKLIFNRDRIDDFINKYNYLDYNKFIFLYKKIIETTHHL
jgi:hypothetical protein